MDDERSALCDIGSFYLGRLGLYWLLLWAQKCKVIDQKGCRLISSTRFTNSSCGIERGAEPIFTDSERSLLDFTEHLFPRCWHFGTMLLLHGDAGSRAGLCLRAGHFSQRLVLVSWMFGVGWKRFLHCLVCMLAACMLVLAYLLYRQSCSYCRQCRKNFFKQFLHLDFNYLTEVFNPYIGDLFLWKSWFLQTSIQLLILYSLLNS